MANKEPKTRPVGATKEIPSGSGPRREGEPYKTPNRSGAYLAHARHMCGLSKAEVAGMLGIGFGTLVKYEWKGITERSDRRNIEGMCKLYSIDEGELFERARERLDVSEGGIFGVG